MRVFIVNGDYDYEKMFTRRGWEIAESVDDSHLVQFTGGSDVSPALYGEDNTESYVSVARDLDDIAVFREALALNKPMAGICRGGQFLNVMSGGKMIQHVVGHATGHQHEAKLADTGEIISVTSTHHQLMFPRYNAGVVLMTANIVGDYDTEAVFYEHTKALCFQPHPEFPTAIGGCRDTYFRFIDEYLFGSRGR